MRRVQAYPGGFDEAVPSEIHRGHRPPPAGADAAPGQGYGAVRDFSFPATSGKLKVGLTECVPAGTKCPSGDRRKQHSEITKRQFEPAIFSICGEMDSGFNSVVTKMVSAELQSCMGKFLRN